MKYRISEYLINVPKDDGLLLFSTLSGGMVYLNDSKYISDFNNMLEQKKGIVCCDQNRELFDMLKSKQMIVQENIVETDIVRMAFLNRYKNNNTLRILIYVTDDCNFKCIYCPQTHVHKYMSDDTMDNIIVSISMLLSHHKFDRLVISWFGGEPLLNMHIIEKGMQAFRRLAQEYSIDMLSGITTNGYLLNKENVDTLLANGVNEYQITLDGDRLRHDKNRHLKNGDGTWTKIWNNLLLMKEMPNEFSVNIRINTNMDNIEFLPQFIEQIRSTFDNRFIIRIQPIIKMGMSSYKTESVDVKYCSLLESQLIQLNMYSYMSDCGCEDLTLENVIEPFGLACSCSDPNYFVIKTDGKICKCELEIDDIENYIGSVNEGTFNIDAIKLTGFVVPSTSQECLECKLYPLCLGLSCPYKRVLGKECTLKNTFMIDEYISTIAQKYISIYKS